MELLQKQIDEELCSLSGDEATKLRTVTSALFMQPIICLDANETRKYYDVTSQLYHSYPCIGGSTNQQDEDTTVTRRFSNLKSENHVVKDGHTRKVTIPYKCQFCNVGFISSQLIEDHLTSTHLIGKKCKGCTIEIYQLHGIKPCRTSTHTCKDRQIYSSSVDVFKCSVCDSVFKDDGRLNMHKRLFHRQSNSDRQKRFQNNTTVKVNDVVKILNQVKKDKTINNNSVEKTKPVRNTNSLGKTKCNGVIKPKNELNNISKSDNFKLKCEVPETEIIKVSQNEVPVVAKNVEIDNHTHKDRQIYSSSVDVFKCSVCNSVFKDGGRLNMHKSLFHRQSSSDRQKRFQNNTMVKENGDAKNIKKVKTNKISSNSVDKTKSVVNFGKTKCNDGDAKNIKKVKKVKTNQITSNSVCKTKSGVNFGKTKCNDAIKYSKKKHISFSNSHNFKPKFKVPEIRVPQDKVIAKNVENNNSVVTASLDSVPTVPVSQNTVPTVPIPQIPVPTVPDKKLVPFYLSSSAVLSGNNEKIDIFTCRICHLNFINLTHVENHIKTEHVIQCDFQLNSDSKYEAVIPEQQIHEFVPPSQVFLSFI